VINRGMYAIGEFWPILIRQLRGLMYAGFLLAFSICSRFDWVNYLAMLSEEFKKSD
jgi:hypothetical protein